MPAEPAYVPTMGVNVMTAVELLNMSIPDKRVELVRGVLIVREPAGYLHGDVTMRLSARLSSHVAGRGLGRVLASETGFKLQSNPDTVRAPDIAFLSTERIPEPRPSGFLTLGPDLVVEVLSPHDRPGEILAKIGDWLEGGVRLVWVVDPERGRARIYRRDGSEAAIGENDSLDGEDVVPGFTCRVAEVL